MLSKTILVIEDDDATRIAFGVALYGGGYRTILAANGSEGLHHLDTQDPPDLIILDMMMTGLDGRFLKKREPRWRSVPVLIVTAHPVASDEWAAALGGCCWLQKPIDGKALVKKVDQCLQPSLLAVSADRLIG